MIYASHHSIQNKTLYKTVCTFYDQILCKYNLKEKTFVCLFVFFSASKFRLTTESTGVEILLVFNMTYIHTNSKLVFNKL